jgi:hypothetical protein
MVKSWTKWSVSYCDRQLYWKERRRKRDIEQGILPGLVGGRSQKSAQEEQEFVHQIIERRHSLIQLTFSEIPRVVCCFFLVVNLDLVFFSRQ